MTGLDLVFYKLALSRASERDLTGAVKFARASLCLNPECDKARRLLTLCLHEINGTGDAPDVFETVRALAAKKKWRKAGSRARKLPHQSVRILSARGCMLAAAGRYAEAIRLFAYALDKDRGNKTVQMYLTNSASRGKAISST